MKADEKKLMTLERKILRRIFGTKKNIENNEYERRVNAELREMFNEIDIVGVLKSLRLSWAGHIWRAEGSLIKIRHNVETRSNKTKTAVERQRKRRSETLRNQRWRKTSYV